MKKHEKTIIISLVVVITFLLLFACSTSSGTDDDDDDPATTTYKITINPSGTGAGEAVTASVSEAAEGTTITLTASLNADRRVTLNAGGVLITPAIIITNNGTATFTMPGNKVVVTACFFTVSTQTVNTVDFTMHEVPSGGTFIMGEQVETRTQTVTLTKDFWMGETEVTQGLWEAVWGTAWPGTAPLVSNGAGANYPAYFVSWYDAAAFCNLLTIEDSTIANNRQVYYSDQGLTTAYTKTDAANDADVYVDWNKNGYRLPTEAEWEYAARYFNDTNWNHGNHVSGDNEYACSYAASCSHELASDARVSAYAWWRGNNSGTEGDPGYGNKEVGQKAVNALGLRDMSGSVYEWCYDWYDQYSGSSVTNPSGAASGNSRVIRSGFWNSPASAIGCASRDLFGPSLNDVALGFRLCRTAD